jgi:hypothetical protein
MGLVLAIVKALTAALSVFRQEREVYNKPELVKAKAADAIQEAKDRLSKAEAVLADPNATPAEHAEALRQVRLAHS